MSGFTSAINATFRLRFLEALLVGVEGCSRLFGLLGACRWGPGLPAPPLLRLGLGPPGRCLGELLLPGSSLVWGPSGTLGLERVGLKGTALWAWQGPGQRGIKLGDPQCSLELLPGPRQ